MSVCHEERYIPIALVCDRYCHERAIFREGKSSHGGLLTNTSDLGHEWTTMNDECLNVVGTHYERKAW
jgi:hypothetical protein